MAEETGEVVLLVMLLQVTIKGQHRGELQITFRECTRHLKSIYILKYFLSKLRIFYYFINSTYRYRYARLSHNKNKIRFTQTFIYKEAYFATLIPKSKVFAKSLQKCSVC